MSICVEVRRNGKCLCCGISMEEVTALQHAASTCVSLGCGAMASKFVMCGEPYGQGDSVFCEDCGELVLKALK